jgi:uncharacterized surface protein with fasciclin (FAS1) repeats
MLSAIGDHWQSNVRDKELEHYGNAHALYMFLVRCDNWNVLQTCSDVHGTWCPKPKRTPRSAPVQPEPTPGPPKPRPTPAPPPHVPAPKPKPNVMQQLAAQATLSNFTKLVQAAGIAKKFTNPTSLVTVFAPTNAAVAKLTSAQFKLLDTAAGLLHHVAYGDILTTALKPTQVVETLTGDKIVVTRGKTAAGVEQVHAETSLVTTADIIASNGVVDIVDRVLLPSAGPTPAPPGPTPKPKMPTPSAPTPASGGKCSEFPKFKISEPDISFYKGIVDLGTCCTLCIDFAGPGVCSAYTVNATGCSLKASSGGITPDSGSTSGVTPKKPTPKPQKPTPAPPGPKPTPAPPPPSNHTHYGNPWVGSCLADESAFHQILHITKVCGVKPAKCTHVICPTDMPAQFKNNPTNEVVCITEQDPVIRSCDIACTPTLGVSHCGPGAQCIIIQDQPQVAICMWLNPGATAGGGLTGSDAIDRAHRNGTTVVRAMQVLRP